MKLLLIGTVKLLHFYATIHHQHIKMPSLNKEFFLQDAVSLAPELLGKTIVRTFNDGTVSRFTITETEAYYGEEDLACHACKGRTPRTEIMYAEGGHIYVYLIYGMYWMLNIVSGPKDHPEAVLIRGLHDVYGPGRVGRILELNKSFYGEDLITSTRIRIEDGLSTETFSCHPRIGIDYAGEPWKNKAWRFTVK